MKAILEFDLPEETQEHLRAVNAMYAWSALSEIGRMVRSHQKHGDPNNAENVLEHIRQEVRSAENWVEN